MIWQAALPGPRIIYFDYLLLEYHCYYRIRSDRAIDDFDEYGFLALFDNLTEIDNDTYRKAHQ